MSTIGEYIADAAGKMRVDFPEEGRNVDLGELYVTGASANFWLERQETSPIAMALVNSSSALACLLGAIVQGLTVVSVPLPPRNADLTWYQAFVEGVCQLNRADKLLVDAKVVHLLPPLRGIEVHSFEETLQHGARTLQSAAGFVLIQYTSGSTADPRGICLGDEHLVANIEAILDRIGPAPGDNACTWLPLSHDMGLIGMLLSSVVAASQGAEGGTLTIISPEAFLRRPGLWLQVCSERRVSITAAPAFGFAMAMQRAEGTHLDLSSLRVCITGGELVNSATLAGFAERFADHGFERRAFCPAYGLAEAGLAVTMTAVDDEWRAVAVDPIALAHGDVVPSNQGSVIVSAGAPLSGYDVAVRGDRSVGAVDIRGPSVMGLYAGEGRPRISEDGWFATHDLGFSYEGEFYPIGRSDDVVIVRGRNLYLKDLEVAVAGVGGVRSGRVAVFADGSGQLVVLAEKDPDLGNSASRRILSAIRSAVSQRSGASPGQIYLLEKGTLPVTTSGKVRRGLLGPLLATARHDAETAQAFGSSVR